MNRLFSLLFILCAITASSSEIAYLENIFYDVYLKSFNDSITVDRGYLITDMDTIRTGLMSNALIHMADNSAAFYIMPKSLFTINARIFDQHAINSLILFEGGLYVNVKKGNYSISSDNAVASLKPGMYYFSAFKGGAGIKCFEGEADIQNEEGNITINANQSAEAMSEQMPYRMPLGDSLNWEKLISMSTDTILIEIVDDEGNMRYMEIIIE